MLRSQHSWTDAHVRWTAVVLALAGSATGVIAEAIASHWSDPRVWLPDLVVGLMLVVVGALAVSSRRPGGFLLVAAGVTWFAGTYASPWLFVHRGPLAHAVLTYPGWRPRSRLEGAAVAIGYIAAAWGLPWRNDRTSVALAVGLVIAALVRRRSGEGRAAHDRSTALGAALLLSVTIVVGATVRRSSLLANPVESVLLGYQAAVCGVAVLLGAGLRRPPGDAVADLVVELGETPSQALRDALRSTLGDPTLEVGYWAGAGTYLDASGNEVHVTPDSDERSVTFVEKEAQPFAVLVHDASVLDDPVLVDAVRAVTRLTAANAALQAEVRARLDALIASRRRLLLAADEERRRLSVRLHDVVQSPLSVLGEQLQELTEADDTESRQHARQAASLLNDTLDDLDRLVEGLHPRDLGSGLSAALQALAERCAVPATVSASPPEDVPQGVATTAYFVVAEALANVAKHSRASAVDISLTCGGDRLVVEVIDDGVGGAEASAGTGLQGLGDRLHAMDGALAVVSPDGGGTRVTAELPLGRETA